MPWVRVGVAALLIGLALVAVAVLARTVIGRSAEGPAGAAGAGAPLAVLRTSDFHALAFSPDRPEVVFFGHHNGVLRSVDGGRTWQPVVDRRGFDAMGMAVSPANPQHVFIAGHDVFQASADGGQSWQEVPHDLPGTDIHGFAMSPDDPARLYAFVNGIGLFRSADAGRTWQRLGQVPPDVMSVAAAGGSPETLYVGSMGAGVLRSADGGQTWVPAAKGLEGQRVLALAAHPVARQTLYAGAAGGLYKSTDGGGSWTKLPFPGQNAVAVAVSPVQPARVLAIHHDMQRRVGEVFRSDDGGQTWAAGGAGAPGGVGR